MLKEDDSWRHVTLKFYLPDTHRKVPQPLQKIVDKIFIKKTFAIKPGSKLVQKQKIFAQHHQQMQQQLDHNEGQFSVSMTDVNSKVFLKRCLEPPPENKLAFNTYNLRECLWVEKNLSELGQKISGLKTGRPLIACGSKVYSGQVRSCLYQQLFNTVGYVFNH